MNRLLAALCDDLASAPWGKRFFANELLKEEETLAWLGQGEVEGWLNLPRRAWVRETRFPGLWYIQEENCAYLEVGSLPSLLLEAGERGEKALCPPMPEGLMNAPGLLVEALEHTVLDEPFQVNLALLPLNQADHLFLEHVLQDEARLVLRGYGETLAEKTIFSRLWRLRFYNVHGNLVLDALEVAKVPEIFAATIEDWQTSQKELLHLT